MSSSGWVFDGTRPVKSIPVIFGGVEAEAIEVMGGGAAGVYVRVPRARPSYSEYKGFDGEGLHVQFKYGQLSCDVCTRRYVFHSEFNHVFSFPFAPLPGWMVWNPSALAQPTGEPQEIAVRVLCDRCSGLRDKWVRDLFEYGCPLTRSAI